MLERGFCRARNSLPAEVSATERVLRSNRRKPTASSSSLINWLTADGLSARRWLAAVKLRISAITMKASS